METDPSTILLKNEAEDHLRDIIVVFYRTP